MPRFSWACHALLLLLFSATGDENVVLVEVHGPAHFGVLSRQRMRASANETAANFRARLSARLCRSVDFLQGHAGGILLLPGESDWDVIAQHSTVSSKIRVSLRVPEIINFTKQHQADKAATGHDRFTRGSVTQRRVHFVTYGDEAYATARDHLKNTALATGLYHTVTVFTEADKARWFASRPGGQYRDDVLGNERGGGYWLWKPMVLHELMERIPENDLVFYCDAGSSHPFSGFALGLLQRTFEEAAREPSGLVTFTTEAPLWRMNAYVKGDVYKHFFAEPRTVMAQDELTLTMAGRIVMRKCAHSLSALALWIEATAYPRLWDDSPSVYPNHPNFIRNFHDQSIWSIILHLKGARRMIAGPEHMPVGRYCRARTPLQLESPQAWVGMNNLIWPCYELCRFVLETAWILPQFASQPAMGGAANSASTLTQSREPEAPQQLHPAHKFEPGSNDNAIKHV